ncbi:hypothetical protein HF072_09890 [Bacillus sp. RO3]|nr:hypothetical protein [Bacillus sp. RO3]
MTNLDKMNALAGTQADKKTIKDWAFHNRIYVISLSLDEDTFIRLSSTEEK